jgi:uncharacterized delta-60 repeat protein
MKLKITLLLNLLFLNQILFAQVKPDPTFNVGYGANILIRKSVELPNKDVIVVGEFTTFNTISKNRLVKLKANGDIDATFNVGTGANKMISDVCVQSDGKIIIVGDFTSYNGVTIKGIARLNTDGSLDNSFKTNLGTGIDGTVYAAALQANGQIVVGGVFFSINGSGAQNLGRINADGTVDATFQCAPGAQGTVYDIEVLTDQTILIGGAFSTYASNPGTQSKLAKLNSDGTLNTAFANNLGSGFNNDVYAIKIQSDGKILIGGSFTRFNNANHNRLVRLLNSGLVDLSFSIGSGADQVIFTVNQQANGKILAGGDFITFNGNNCKRLVQLNDNGSVDTGFNIGSGFSIGIVKHINVLSDNKMLLVGNFTSFNGVAHDRILRLLPNCAGPATVTETKTACGSYVWRNGFTYTTSTNTATHTVTGVAAGGCDSIYTLNVTIYPNLNAGAIQATGESICASGDPSSIGNKTLASGGDGNYTYQWYSSTNSFIYTPISGATSSSYDPPAGLTEKTWFMRQVDDGFCSASLSDLNKRSTGRWIVDVKATSTVGAASSTPTVCINTAITPITHLITNATGIGTATGLPSGVTASFATNTITISGTPTASGTFSYNIPLTGGCGTASATGTITVTPTNTVGTASSTPTLCENSTLTAITHATTGVTGIGNVTGLPTGVQATLASNTLTISGTPSTSGTFNYSIALIGGCGNLNATGTMVVNPLPSKPTLTPTGGITALCVPATLTITSDATTGNQWYQDGTIITGATNASYTATVSGSYTVMVTTSGCSSDISDPVVFTLNVSDATPTIKHVKPLTFCDGKSVKLHTSSTADIQWFKDGNPLPGEIQSFYIASTQGSYTVKVTNSSGCVSGQSAPAVVIVDPLNTVSTASATPTVCIQSAITDITHTTSGVTGFGTPSGLPAGITVSFASNTLTLSGTPTESGTFNYTIPLTGGCGLIDATGTITVSPLNTIATASATPTVCIGTAMTAITHASTSATGIGSATGLPTGVTASFASNTLTVSGTPSASGTFNYSIPLTGGCGNVTATGTITVAPTNTVSAASDAPTICVNTALSDITHSTTGATGIGSATDLPAGVTAAFASNTITISGTPTTSGTFNYSIPLTGGCGVANATGSIIVNAINTAAGASSTPTLCNNTALIDITHATSGASGIGTATNLPTGLTADFAADVITISGTPSVSGTFNYSIPLTGGCGTVSATGTITVTPTNSVSMPSAIETICINTTLVDITHTTTGALAIGTPSGFPAGLTIDYTSNVITISGTPTETGMFDYTIPLTGGCGTLNATGIISVVADNTVSAASATPTLCTNTLMTDVTHTTTGVIGVGSATGLPAGLSVNYTTDLITISGTPTESGTFNYSIPLTGGCGSISATGTITVNTVTDPTGQAVQNFNNAGKTIADLVVTGTNITWYANSSDALAFTNSLATSTAVVDGDKYYAVATENNCNSQPLEVTVAITTNVELGSIHDLKIFPNPTEDLLNVQLNRRLNNVNVNVYDAQMQLVKTFNYVSTELIQFNVEGENGLYYALINSDEKNYHFKFIKR